MLQPRPKFQGIAGPTRKPSGGENDNFSPIIGALGGVAAVALQEITQRKEQFDTLAYDSANRDVEAELTRLELAHDGDPSTYTEKSTEYIKGRYSDLNPEDPRTQLGVTRHLGSVNRGTLRHTKTMNRRNDKSTEESTVAELSSAGQYASQAIADSEPFSPSESIAIADSISTINQTIHDSLTRTYSYNEAVVAPEKAKELLSGYEKGMYVDIAQSRALSSTDSTQLREAAESIKTGDYRSNGARFDEESMSLVEDGAISAESVLPSPEDRDRLAGFFERRANDLDRADAEKKRKAEAASLVEQQNYLNSLDSNAVAEISLSEASVTDADTIGVFTGHTTAGGEKVFKDFRLDGVDAIEFGQSFTNAAGETITGEQARDFAVEWLSRSGITFHRTGADDVYGRALGRFVDEEGNTLGSALIQRGFAYHSDAFGDHPLYAGIQAQVRDNVTGDFGGYLGDFASQHRAFKETDDSPRDRVLIANENPPEPVSVPRPTQDSMSPENWQNFKALEAKQFLDNQIKGIVRTNTPRERTQEIERLIGSAPTDTARTALRKNYNKQLSTFENEMEADPYNTILNLYPKIQQTVGAISQMPAGLERDIFTAEVANLVNRLANRHVTDHIPIFPEFVSDGITDAISAFRSDQTDQQYGVDVANTVLGSIPSTGGNNNVNSRALAEYGFENDIPYFGWLAPITADGRVSGKAYEHLRSSSKDNIATFGKAEMYGGGKKKAAVQLRENVDEFMRTLVPYFPKGASSGEDFDNLRQAIFNVARGDLATSTSSVYGEESLDRAMNKAINVTLDAQYTRVGDTLLVPNKDWAGLTKKQRARLDVSAANLARSLVFDSRLKGNMKVIDGETDRDISDRALARHAIVKITRNPMTGVAQITLMQNNSSDFPVGYIVHTDDKGNELTVDVSFTLDWVADNIKPSLRLTSKQLTDSPRSIYTGTIQDATTTMVSPHSGDGILDPSTLEELPFASAFKTPAKQINTSVRKAKKVAGTKTNTDVVGGGLASINEERNK